MLDHHPLGRSGRAGGVDEVGQVFGPRAVLGRGGGRGRDACVVERYDPRRVDGQPTGQAGVRQDHRRAGIRDVMRDPVGRVAGVQRHIGAARLQDADCARDQVRSPRGEQPDRLVGAHARRDQRVRDPVRPRVEFGKGKLAILEHQRGGVGGQRRLRRKGRVHGLGLMRLCGVVPGAKDAGAVLVRHQLGRAQGGAARTRKPRHQPTQRRDGPRGQAGRVEGQDQPVGRAVGQVQDQPAPVALHTRRRDSGNRTRHGGKLGHPQRQVRQPARAVKRLPRLRHLRREAIQGQPGIARIDVQRNPVRDIAGRRGVAQQGKVVRVQIGRPRQGRGEQGRGLVRGHRAGQRDLAVLRGRGAVMGGRVQHRRGHRDQPLAPEPFARGRACHRVVKRLRLGPGGRGQHPARRQRRPVFPAVGGDQRVQPHRAVRAGDHDRLIFARQDRARRALALSVIARCDLGRADGDHPPVERDLGRQQWVRIGPVVKAPDQRDKLGRGPGEIQPPRRRGPPGAFEQGAARQVLRGAGRVGFQQPQQLGETALPRLPRLGVQGQGGILGLDGEVALDQHPALVDPALDAVPGDPVPRLARDPGPGGRVQPRIGGKRAVMEVDRALARQLQHGVGHQVQVGDAQHPIDRVARQSPDQRPVPQRGRRVNRDPGIARPGGGPGVARHDRGDAVATGARDLAALTGQGFVADQQQVEGRHGHLLRRLPGPEERRSGTRPRLATARSPPAGRSSRRPSLARSRNSQPPPRWARFAATAPTGPRFLRK